MAAQKRSAEEAESLLIGVKSIVFDIEGTTTPIDFVKETLFPYVRNNIDGYLEKNFETPELQKAITGLRELASKDAEEKKEGVVAIPAGDATKDDVVKAVKASVMWQMDQDRKSTELKSLQGMIWKEGYTSGEIRGQLFEDVGPMLRMLQVEEGMRLYIFSSGSVEAQKLLFTHSTAGDLSDLFDGHFDTTTGNKRESASYKKIAAEIGNEPKDVLFLTDIPEEAEAAVTAGMRAALVIRPGNHELTDANLQDFACIERFDELYGDEEDEEDLKRFHGDDSLGEDDDEDDEDEDDDEVDDEDDEELDGEGDDGEDDEDPDDV